MIYNSITDIPYTPDKAIIINVETPEYTTQTLLSLRQGSDIPLVIIDCPYKSGGNYEYFDKLQSEYKFDLIKMPLQKHGYTLDQIFSQINANYLCLIDSDIEFVGYDDGINVVEYMRMVLNSVGGGVFGAGIISKPTVLTHESMRGQNFGLYQERMMIPITMLSVNLVREALQEGYSFIAEMEYNDIPFLPWLNRWLFKRFSHKRTFNSRLGVLDIFRNEYFGQKPCCVFNDTGARVWMYLKYNRKYEWIEPEFSFNDCVRHYHGATRNLLYSGDPNSGQGADNEYSSIDDKLKKKYNFNIEEYRYR